MSRDDLGDRMKMHESKTSIRLDVTTPVYARVDGRTFSSYTRHMKKPFDPWMTEAMILVCKHLVKHTHATLGYVQSDEISLVWPGSPDPERKVVFFDGKLLKMCSVIASMAGSKLMQLQGDRISTIPNFDCRAFNLPNRSEATNAFLWRWFDARRNGVRSIAHSIVGHDALMGVSRVESVAMLAAAGVDIGNYPKENIYGTFVKPVTIEKSLTDDELMRIPEGREPTDPIMRTELKTFVFEDFISVDREAFIFGDD